MLCEARIVLLQYGNCTRTYAYKANVEKLMNTDLVNVADVAERQSGSEGRRCIGSQVKRRGRTTDIVER